MAARHRHPVRCLVPIWKAGNFGKCKIDATILDQLRCPVDAGLRIGGHSSGLPDDKYASQSMLEF